MPLPEHLIDETGLKLVAAPFTPLGAGGELNLAVLPDYARYLRSQGVGGVFIAGTTGEGLSLTTRERMALAEAWIAAAAPVTLETIVHVGHSSVRESTELARHAAQAGANAIAALGPVFFTPANAEAVANACGEIAAATSGTPFLYYHIPSMTRGAFQASELLLRLEKRVHVLGGLKFTHDDLEDYQRCLEIADGRYPVYFGRDERLLEALRLGGNAAVGSTYNFAAPLYRRMVQALRRGNQEEATRLQRLAAAGIDAITAAGGLPAFKAVMSAVTGITCGPVRLPLTSLPQSETAALLEELRRLGYLDELAASQLRGA